MVVVRAWRRRLGGILGESPRQTGTGDQRRLPWLHDLLEDVRYGLRALGRSPGFTAVALTTVALAIGANTAIFSLVDPLLFRDLPVRDPSRLVEFVWRYPGDPPLNLFAVNDRELYLDRGTVFSEMAGVAPLLAESPTGGQPVRAEVAAGKFCEV